MSSNRVSEKLIGDIRRRLDKPVALVGLMGVGKTRMGRLLAKTLGCPFVDSDHEIERAAGMSVSDIFDMFDEAYFRDGEHRVIKRIVNDTRSGEVKVIATGGGALTHAGTASLLWKETVTIWLQASLDIMVERTSRTDKRPLLQNGDARDILERMVEKRYPVYEKADIVVESFNGPVSKILNNMLEKLDLYLRSQQNA